MGEASSPRDSLARRVDAVTALYYAPLGRGAARLAAPCPARPPVALLALTDPDVQSLDRLTEAVDALTRLLSELQADELFWRGRAERTHRLGPVLGTAVDVLEGGPWEWWVVAQRWRVSAPGTPVAGLLVSPRERVDGLSSVIDDAAVLLGTLLATSARVLRELNRETDGVGSVASHDARALLAVRLYQGSGGASPPPPSTLQDAVHALQKRTCPARPAYQRNWLRFTLMAVGAYAAARYVGEHYGSLTEWGKASYTSAASFMAEHVVVPFRDIAREVFGGQRVKVADESALRDAKDSLSLMLADFYARLHKRGDLRVPGLDLASADLASLAQRLDMRPASTRFALESAKPIVGFVTGDLLEVMLIQVAFIKKEVLAALAAMDTILAENRVNFAVAASLPAIMILYGAAAAGGLVYHTATAPVDTTEGRYRVQHYLRDLLRLLDNLRPTEVPCAHSNEPAYDGLTKTEAAFLCASVRRVYDALSAHHALGGYAESRRHVEDLADVLNPTSSLHQRRRAAMRFERFKFVEDTSLYSSLL